MIEGTQSSLSDLLLFEMDLEPGVPLDDVREVSNYVAALDHGLGLLEGGLPLSLRLLREVHGVLLSKGRGSQQGPGEFRRGQNWIGGTRPGNAVFVPPPAEEVPACMNALDLFLHDQPEPTHVLLTAALAHVQFESIHPAPCADWPERLKADANAERGEFVLVLHAAPPAGAEGELPAEALRVLKALLAELPLKQAVALAAQLSGAPRNALYQQALAWRQAKDNDGEE